MKDIKTKEVTTKPKTKNPASRIPKELMRTAILESKEKSQTIANARDNDMGEQSPSEYASGKVASAEEWAARKTGRTVTRAGKTAAQTSYEKIKQRAAGKKEAEKEIARGTGDTQTANPASREAQEAQIREVQIQEAQRQKVVSDAVKTKEQKIRAARETPRIQNRQEIAEMKQLSIREQSQKKEAKDTVRQTAIRQKQPETIRIKEKPRKQPEPKTIQKRIIKTAPQSAKISVQPEQKLRAASSNALTARMQKQMERRAAKQAAKKAAMQTSNNVRRMQKTARAGQNTFKAAKAAVEAAAKTVQSMMAALGAAGAVIVLLLVIMVGIIGGAAFSGSSESNEALSQEVLSYTTAIQKYANQYGIPEYVSVIQAIMMQESGGRGTDPMQSSECPYNTRYSNKIDGYGVCEVIRQKSNVPIIMLTALDGEESQIKGLDLQADDYITKPFSMPVLIRKIAAILRRTSKQEDTPHIMSYKDLTLDLDGYKVYSSEGNIELTPREFEILRELLNHKGRILTRQNFLQTLWKYEFFGDERIIDTHIKNLRKKLGTVDYIETIRGVGYRIDKEDKE